MVSTIAGELLVSGSVLFLLGAGLAVPRVFIEPDGEEKLRMLTERSLRWRLGQPLYALGALVAALGVGLLPAEETVMVEGWRQRVMRCSTELSRKPALRPEC